ncbi:myeloid cell surface antigen CD33-like [Cololabis saira]|uniref:myeloid cell surface antigen CD33-like n=1 Tax=Cololabis saira TaxID=129043 RepID=UPI002AD27E7D|nr:myeloid cell surface antigen CD33-like [Cololabis saira]
MNALMVGWLVLLTLKTTGASGREHCTKRFCITLNEQLRAEAGLCVVIPCSLRTGFPPQDLVWFKCEPGPKKCVESDMIFHSNNANKKLVPGFKGRVSLLGSETRGNCSIMINDLQESDSGSYQVRVSGFWYHSPDGFTFDPKTTVSINGLNQKPTLKVPALTEGQESTLTCTAPGLCSGSRPEITWTWGGAGEMDSNIPGNITGVQTDEVSAVAQRHSSTLKFNLSADHHDTNITCKVRFTGGATTEDTVTLKMNYSPQHTRIIKGGEQQLSDGRRSVTLICMSLCYPPATYVWYNKTDGREILTSQPQVITVNSDQAGEYYCTARNDVGQRSSESIRPFDDVAVNSHGTIIYTMNIVKLFLIFGILLTFLHLFIFFRHRRNESVQDRDSWMDGARENVMSETGLEEPLRSRDVLSQDLPSRPKAQQPHPHSDVT